MARYIDEKFIRAAMFHPLPYTHITPPDVDVESFKRGWNDALDAVLANSASADVRENIRGEWIHKITHESLYDRTGIWCSNCGKDAMQDGDGYYVYDCETDFCPWCGADMRGGDA